MTGRPRHVIPSSASRSVSGDEHRPDDYATLRVAALELRSLGLTARDIAIALRVSETAVVALLANDCMETQP